ncbi:MAG: Stk1 family PASTA domain-containing Ser/Thr kinase [Candidatus Eremiobacteraeota bacterium]|nr:Stk1 family PASTA domain-containing Ser/Thr kinase [Candidatus Eremiobacteraeota bacterium]
MIDERTFNNRYRIERRLGDGGMAVVYAGTDTVLRRRVAIKVLREQYAADEEFVRRFYYEAQAAAKLSHPNIVNTYDVGTEDHAYYIVMEVVDGTTLAEMFRSESRIPEPVAIDYAAQVCNGLAYAHRQGLLHRDIKPANILITPDDVVKLSDFGIARAVTQQTLAVTQPGMVMGSVYYLSPEQAQGYEVRETSDLYSVGVVLFQMLSGRLPYSGDSPVTVALKHVSESIPPLGGQGAEVSPALAAIVTKLLQKNPADRFQSASDVASALREARERPLVAAAAVGLRDDGLAAQPARGPMRPPPRRPSGPADWSANDAPAQSLGEPAGTRASRGVIAGLIVALLAAMGGGYLLVSGAGWLGHAVVVADESGKSAIDAQREIEAAGLHAKLAGVPSDTVPSDRVVRQDPPPGSRLAQGSDVQLFVSTGVAPRDLDDVAGFTVADAQTTLLRAGFKTKILEKFSAQPKGVVLATDPKAHTSARPGSVVTLVVSKGVQPVPVPDVVGHTLGFAQDALTRAKFKIAVENAPFDNVPNGQVAVQDPAPGAAAAPGSTVTLQVSTGPAQVGVPNVGGQTLVEAQNGLVAAGFNVHVTYAVQQPADGTVVQQDPAPSANAPKGSTVNVVVAVPGVVPDVTGMTPDQARQALTRAGYVVGNVTYVQEGQDGIVARTEPVANLRVAPGESVNLYVNGTGPAAR